MFLFSSSSEFRYTTKDLFPHWEACVYSGETSRKSLSPVSAKEHPCLMTSSFQSLEPQTAKISNNLQNHLSLFCALSRSFLWEKENYNKACYSGGFWFWFCCFDSPMCLQLNLFRLLSNENPMVQRDLLIGVMTDTK